MPGFEPWTTVFAGAELVFAFSPQFNIICIINNVAFADMGDYQVVVSTPDNVRKSIDMRLRVFADKPAVKFFDVSKNSFYPNNRFENQFKLRWHSTEVAFVQPPAPGSTHGPDFISCRDISLTTV